MVRGETDEETNDFKTRQCTARYVEANVGCSEKESKHKWAIEKPKLDDARKLGGIFFIEPDDEEFKPIMKNSRRKLEVPMPPVVLCKIQIKSRGETHRSIGKRKTKYACIVDADESMRIRLEGVPQRYHEDHITAKDVHSLNHYNLVHKFIPVPQAMKIPDAKAAVEKNGKNWRKSGMAADESQMIQDHTQYLLNKDHQHHRRQPQKSWTFFQDYQDVQDKQQMQYPLILRSEWKMHRC